MNRKTLGIPDSINLVIILVLGVALKLIFGLQKDLNNDEIFSIYHAQFNLKELYRELSTGNNPPFFEGLLHFWIKLFGIGSFSARFPSLIFSVFSSFLVYKIAKFVSDKNQKIGLLACLLFTLSSFYIDLQIESRAYSLMTCLILLNSYAFINLIQRNSEKFWAKCWILATVLGYYTHFFTFWISIVQLIFIILHFRKINIKIFILGAVISAILFSPYLSILWDRFTDTEQSGTWVEAASSNSFYFVIWQFCNSPLNTILFLAGFIGFSMVTVKNKSILYRYISLWFWIPFGVMFCISLPHKFSIPMFTERYVSFVFPAFFIGVSIISIELKNILHKKFLNYFPILCILLMIIPLKSRPYKNVFSETTKEYLKTCKPKSIILQPHYGAFSYLYFNEAATFKSFATSNIYDHMENQLKENHIYTTRLHSIKDLYLPSSILFIQGEVSRNEEVQMVDSLLKLKRYTVSNLFEGKNSKIGIYTK